MKIFTTNIRAMSFDQPVIVWGPAGLLTGGHVLLGLVGVAFPERRLLLSILFSICHI
jgi:hypothetical protein